MCVPPNTYSLAGSTVCDGCVAGFYRQSVLPDGHAFCVPCALYATTGMLEAYADVC
jgi:hypothetical protein